MNRDDRTIVIARYRTNVEAHLALNLLLREGIPCFLGNELGNSFFGASPIENHVTLNVEEADAARATALLAEVEMNATLDDDWESIAEQTAVCTLCGEPLESEDVACSSCDTPRDGIRPSNG